MAASKWPLKHGRDVEIKVLRGDVARTVGAERFLTEIDLAAKLTHPHILPLYDSDEADGMVYFVMPNVEGRSLRDSQGQWSAAGGRGRPHRQPRRQCARRRGSVGWSSNGRSADPISVSAEQYEGRLERCDTSGPKPRRTSSFTNAATMFGLKSLDAPDNVCLTHQLA
jgi:hypothetical protein